MKTSIVRYPVVSYFGLAFAISWGGVLFVLWRGGGRPGSAAEAGVLVPAAALMLAGPCVAGLLLTALGRGTSGLRACLASALNWRVDGRWYAVALLTAPLSTIAVVLASSLFSAGLTPAILTTANKPALLLVSIAAGLTAGVVEEVGWTGFAVPALRARYGVLPTGLIVGVLWGAWHLILVVLLMNAPAAPLPPAPVLALALFAVLPAFRLLMVRVHEATGSLLLAILMHASLTATSLLASPQGAGGPL